MKKTILVAIDGSVPALGALEEALKIASGTGCSITLASVVETPVFPSPVAAEVITRFDEASRSHADMALATARERVEQANVACELVVRRGAPAETLAAMAEAPEVWMVAVGSRGLNTMARVFVGSTSDRLVHLCKKPVLVVH